jgi:cytochrome c peroxidase
MLRALGSASLLLAAAVAQTNFPPPSAPTGNPPSPQKELLGMALFFEEQLSSTSTVACATCHDFTRGGVDARTSDGVNPGADGLFGTADDQRGSPGIASITSNGIAFGSPAHGFGAAVTGRRAPTVVNSGYHSSLMYDGSKQSLEDLVAAPPVNPVEMGHIGRTWTDVVQKLAGASPLVFASNLPARLQTFVNGRTYPQMFQLAFGSTQITQGRVAQAIASYLRTLNSDQSKFDRYLNGLVQLTPQEQTGLQLFNSPANGATSCNTCHGDFEPRVRLEGPKIGQLTTQFSGPYGAPVPTLLLFHNVGVRPSQEDPGRLLVTSLPVDQGKFRVASLRNVALAAPYFHNGSVDTLNDVLDFYDRGGDFHDNQAALLTPRNYTIQEKDAIVALLNTLTDPRLAAGSMPFDRPTLGSQNGNLVTSIGQANMVAHAPMAPRVGEPWFQLTLEQAPVSAFTFLLWDTAPNQGTAVLPGLELALSPSFVAFPTGMADWHWLVPGGTKRVPLPLPNVPSLSGQTLYAQFAAYDLAASAPLSFSNALRIRLQ